MLTRSETTRRESSSTRIYLGSSAMIATSLTSSSHHQLRISWVVLQKVCNQILTTHSILSHRLRRSYNPSLRTSMNRHKKRSSVAAVLLRRVRHLGRWILYSHTRVRNSQRRRKTRSLSTTQVAWFLYLEAVSWTKTSRAQTMLSKLLSRKMTTNSLLKSQTQPMTPTVYVPST